MHCYQGQGLIIIALINKLSHLISAISSRPSHLLLPLWHRDGEKNGWNSTGVINKHSHGCRTAPLLSTTTASAASGSLHQQQLFKSHLSIYCIYLSVLSISLSFYISIYLSIYIYLSVLSICLSIYLSICLSIYLAIYLTCHVSLMR